MNTRKKKFKVIAKTMVGQQIVIVIVYLIWVKLSRFPKNMTIIIKTNTVNICPVCSVQPNQEPGLSRSGSNVCTFLLKFHLKQVHAFS